MHAIKKRIGYIGLSYPIMYDTDRVTKSWVSSHGPVPPHPILDSPFGLMVLYDELWFLNEELCPINMRRLHYVKFVDKMYEDINYPALYNFLENFNCDVTFAKYKSVKEVKQALGIKGNPFWGSFVWESNIEINGLTYTASATPKNYYFDLLIWSEIQKRTKDGIELVTNINFTFGEFDARSSQQEVTNALIIRGLPNYLERYGPYHPCMEEIRDSQFLIDYRKWLLENHGHLQTMEVVEMQESVEREISRIYTDVLLKYLQNNSFGGLAKTTSKTVFNTTMGALPIIGLPFSVGAGSIDIAKSAKQSNAAQKVRWSGFILETRQILQGIEKNKLYDPKYYM